MKKGLNSYTRIVIKLCIVSFITIGFISIISCKSSSSGDDSTPITYSGITTPATIDGTNAEDLALGALTGSELNAGLSFFGATQTQTHRRISYAPFIKISQLSNHSLNLLDVKNKQNTSYTGAVVTVTDTVTGDCGGTFSYTFLANDQTGAFSGSYTLSNLCSEGMTMSGSMDCTGTINIATRTPVNVTLNFTDFTITDTATSATFSGTLTLTFGSTSTSMAINVYMKNNNTGDISWINNLTITITEGGTYFQEEMSGRFYDPSNGYIDVSTTTPFITNDTDEYPSQGVLIVTGAGSTKAKLTALSATTYQIEADTDGNDTYDWDSGILNWSESSL